MLQKQNVACNIFVYCPTTIDSIWFEVSKKSMHGKGIESSSIYLPRDKRVIKKHLKGK